MPPVMLRSFLPWILAIVFVLSTLAVLTHSHLDLFSCSRDDFVYGAGRGGYGMQNRETARCSLMYFTDPDLAHYNAKLDPAGRMLAIIVGLVIPAALGLTIGRAIARRPRDRSGQR